MLMFDVLPSGCLVGQACPTNPSLASYYGPARLLKLLERTRRLAKAILLVKARNVFSISFYAKNDMAFYRMNRAQLK